MAASSLVTFLSGVFKHGGSSGGNKVRSCVVLIHICFRTTVTTNVNVGGLTVFPSLHIFGSALRIPAAGGGLNINRGGTYGGVVGRVCRASSVFFHRVSRDVHGGYGGIRSTRACLIRFRKFARSVVVLLNGLVGFGLHLPSFVGNTLQAVARGAIGSVFAGGSFHSTRILHATMTVHGCGRQLNFSRP